MSHFLFLLLSGCSLVGNHDRQAVGVDLNIRQTIECKAECKADQTFSGERSTHDDRKTVEGAM